METRTRSMRRAARLLSVASGIIAVAALTTPLILGLDGRSILVLVVAEPIAIAVFFLGVYFSQHSDPVFDHKRRAAENAPRPDTL